MPSKNLHISDVEFTLYYLAEYDNAGAIQYLQSIRSVGCAFETSGTAAEYKAMKDVNADRLFALAKGNYDAIVMAPSSRMDAQPYFEKLLICGGTDCTSRFSKSSNLSAGVASTTSQALADALDYAAVGDESGFDSILLVDDIFNTGKTIVALISKLRDAGLRNDCKITVAVPLLIE